MLGRICGELNGIDLGDARLNRRSQLLIETLNMDTTASINGVIEKWSDTVAAYRLLDNKRVTPDGILKPHYEASLNRIREHPVILLVQDTSELDFSKHPPRDAQCLTKPNRFGLFTHTHLAITPAGLPVGVMGNEFHDRAPESLGKTLERRNLPIEEKESMRWLTGYRLACTVQQQCDQSQVISVSDSEADMYDILMEAQAHASENADYIIRSKENRCLNERIPPAEHTSRNVKYRKLRDEISKIEACYNKTIELPQTPKRPKRTAKLEVRAQTITLKHPKNRPGLPSVTCNIVSAQEIDRCESTPATPDDPDIEWWLLTSLPVETQDDIETVLEYYKARWHIEVFFRTLKTGCRIEDCQLETTARLKNYIAFNLIIAWRVMCLTHLNRTAPETPCDQVFSAAEWKSVWRVATRKPLPSKPPTLGQFIRVLASLAGYNNRAKEPPPGPQTIWRATRRMADFAIAWQAIHET